MKDLPKIVIVVPAFNEEKSIGFLLYSLFLPHSGFDIHVIVVNDGSRDKTELILRKWEQVGRNKITVITHPFNLGIGKSVQTGFKAALKMNPSVVIQMDADGQHLPAYLENLVNPILDFHTDVVVGSRYCDGGGGNISSIFREMGTNFFSELIYRITKVRIYDTTSGYRAFGIAAAQLVSKEYEDDYPEVLSYLSLIRGGFRIIETPVTMARRTYGQSSITFFKGIHYMLKVTFLILKSVLRDRKTIQLGS